MTQVKTPHQSLQSSLALLRVLQLLLGCFVAAAMRYYSLFLVSFDLSGGQMGSIQMLRQLTLVLIPAWALLANRVKSITGVIRTTAVLALAGAVCLLNATRMETLWVATAVMWLGVNATQILMEVLTLRFIQGMPEKHYAGFRVFQSLGFVLSAPAIGWLLDSGWKPGRLIPIWALGATAGAALVVFCLREPKEDPGLAKEEGHEPLGANGALLAFFIAAALHALSSTPHNSLFPIFVHEQGLNSAAIGLSSSIETGTEILVLASFGYLDRRMGPASGLLVAFAGTALRWFLLGSSHQLAPILATGLFHACSISIYIGASSRLYLTLLRPAQMATARAAQAVLVGGAGAAGVWLSGIAFEKLGRVAPLYTVAGFVESGAVLIALLSFRRWSAPTTLPGKYQASLVLPGVCRKA